MKKTAVFLGILAIVVALSIGANSWMCRVGVLCLEWVP